MRIPRSGRRPSLALSPQVEAVWWDYECIHGREVLLEEFEAIASDTEGMRRGVTPSEMQLRIAEIEVVIERARFGELVERGELKSINVDPELWEIRTRINNKPVRIYHAEPQSFTDLMVGLRAHFKWVDGPDGEIVRRQNVEISRAIRRFREGSPRQWRGPTVAVPCPPGGQC